MGLASLPDLGLYPRRMMKHSTTITINMSDGREFVDVEFDEPPAEAIELAKSTYPGWSSMVVVFVNPDFGD